jgi:ribosomal-protein-alanine N-acetyltransferase
MTKEANDAKEAKGKQVPSEAPFMARPRICLQPHGEQDIPPFITWVNDPETRHYSRNFFPQAFESEKKWLADNSNYSAKSDSMSFGIWLSEEKRIIGSIGLFAISYPDANCWMGLLIGDKNCWGKGYATDAGALILDYAFGELGMHKVIVGIYSPNQRSQGVARKLGFTLSGVIKDEVFVDGKFVDGFVFEMMRDAWVASRFEKLSSL